MSESVNPPTADTEVAREIAKLRVEMNEKLDRVLAEKDEQIPLMDRMRLEMVTFTYAAAMGYGFSVLDTAPWVLQPLDWSQAVSVLKACWPGLWLYLWVFLFIAIDWLYIRRVYFREKVYGRADFVLDMLIIFFFVRMMHDAITVVAKGTATANFAYWWWLGLVYAAYIVWDLLRISTSYRELRGKPGALRQAFASQKWSLPADCLALVFFSLIYWFSTHCQAEVGLTAVVFSTPVVYLLTTLAWMRDIKASEPKPLV